MLIAAVFSLIIIELQKVELSGLNGEEVDLHRATNQRYWGELPSTAGEVHLHHQVPPLLDRLPPSASHRKSSSAATTPWCTSSWAQELLRWWDDAPAVPLSCGAAPAWNAGQSLGWFATVLARVAQEASGMARTVRMMDDESTGKERTS